jgi:hypothetical protein
MAVFGKRLTVREAIEENARRVGVDLTRRSSGPQRKARVVQRSRAKSGARLNTAFDPTNPTPRLRAIARASMGLSPIRGKSEEMVLREIVNGAEQELLNDDLLSDKEIEELSAALEAALMRLDQLRQSKAKRQPVGEMEVRAFEIGKSAPQVGETIRSAARRTCGLPLRRRR